MQHLSFGKARFQFENTFQILSLGSSSRPKDHFHHQHYQHQHQHHRHYHLHHHCHHGERGFIREGAHVLFAWLSSWQLKPISDLQMAKFYTLLCTIVFHTLQCTRFIFYTPQCKLLCHIHLKYLICRWPNPLLCHAVMRLMCRLLQNVQNANDWQFCCQCWYWQCECCGSVSSLRPFHSVSGLRPWPSSLLNAAARLLSPYHLSR